MFEATDSNALPPNTLLFDRYTLIKVLGEGGFGITYLAKNAIGKQFAIKEYLPQDQAVRDSQSQQVKPRTNRTEDFNYGLQQFLEEAKNLVPFCDHPNIVSVVEFLKNRGTAYLVMDYEAGQTLSDRLKKQPPLVEADIIRIILEISEGLAEVHQQGILHRDIKPANIYLRQNNSAFLIDFGSSRYALGEKSKSLSAIISVGYAPPEQYTKHGKQGTYTDLYALGATLYKMLTGQAPIESIARREAIANGEADPYISATEKGRPEYAHWLKVLTDQLLVLAIQERPDNIQLLKQALLTQQPLAIEHTKIVREEDRWEKKEPKRKIPPNPQKKTKLVKETERWQKTKRPIWKIMLVLVSFALAGAGYWFLFKPWWVERQEQQLYQQALKTNSIQSYQDYLRPTWHKVTGQRFIKISKNGQKLAKNASKWACVLDTKTNLYWEVKTGSGLHSKYKQYRWGGKTALITGDGERYKDWDKLVEGSNNEALCGLTGWRVPFLPELRSIVDHKEMKPAINVVYFPNTQSGHYWSSSPNVSNPFNAWVIDFEYGDDYYAKRKNEYPVRLVRAGQ